MITVEGLTRKYGSFTAVDDVSFVCQPGRVTGFLGPNGAGKTTTMRVMVGLTPPTSGRVTIGGHLYHDIPNPGRHVGVLLDASAQHAGRTGREILTIGAQTMGLPESRVDEMLELVSLDQTEAKRRLRNYSLGMKQRLGIAHALLGDPSVLILDEPANGLDPAGIRDMRSLVKRLADSGLTVLLSSHDMDFDWADEQIHAHYGARWLKYFLEKANDPRKPIEFRAVAEEAIKAIRDSATPADREQTERAYRRTMQRARELASDV